MASLAFDALPDDTLGVVLSHLPAKDIASVARVNRFFHSLCTADSLWQQLCLRDFGHIAEPGTALETYRCICQCKFALYPEDNTRLMLISEKRNYQLIRKQNADSDHSVAGHFFRNSLVYFEIQNENMLAGNTIVGWSTYTNCLQSHQYGEDFTVCLGSGETWHNGVSHTYMPPCPPHSILSVVYDARPSSRVTSVSFAKDGKWAGPAFTGVPPAMYPVLCLYNDDDSVRVLMRPQHRTKVLAALQKWLEQGTERGRSPDTEARALWPTPQDQQRMRTSDASACTHDLD